MNTTLSIEELIKKNYEKIKGTTPINPSITKDDEWRSEDCWDELYRKMESR